ncbi:MAG TPA: ion transporter [Ohtaekwangia sp.]|nr:ion transporter [Ohtaekwangia sp.]
MPHNQPAWKKRLYEIIFEADTTSGKLFDITLLSLIILSTLSVMLESIPGLPPSVIRFFYILEWAFTGIFTLEYILRILVVHNRKRYIFSFLGIVDFLSILPAYLALLISGAQVLIVIRTIRLLRVFRILKLARFIGAGNTLQKALFASRHKISVFLMTVLMTVIISGTIMFLVEGRENGFTSIPKSIYWAIVTMTTVGYGDIAPQTAFGQALASMIMILGYGIIAVPTGIVSAEMVQLKSREKLSTQVCPHCMREEHDSDAVYCKFCGGILNI